MMPVVQITGTMETVWMSGNPMSVAVNRVKPRRVRVIRVGWKPAIPKRVARGLMVRKPVAQGKVQRPIRVTPV